MSDLGPGSYKFVSKTVEAGEEFRIPYDAKNVNIEKEDGPDYSSIGVDPEVTLIVEYILPA